MATNKLKFRIISVISALALIICTVGCTKKNDNSNRKVETPNVGANTETANITEAFGNGPFAGFIQDTKPDFIDVYTEKDGEYIVSIPWEIVDAFPATERSTETGWMSGNIGFYCGNIDEFLWAVVTAGPAMQSSHVNVATSQDGGKTWNTDKERNMRDGVVTGALFISDKIGFITYEDRMYNRPRINRTTDGGVTWDIKEFEVPGGLSGNSYFTTLMPSFDGNCTTCPVEVTENGQVTTMVNLVSADSGSSWEWRKISGEDSKEKEIYVSTSVPDPNTKTVEFKKTEIVPTSSWSKEITEEISYDDSTYFVDAVLDIYEKELPDTFILTYGDVSFACEQVDTIEYVEYTVSELCVAGNYYVLPTALPLSPLEFHFAAAPDTVVVGGTFDRSNEKYGYLGRTVWYYITDGKVWQMENVPVKDGVKYNFYSGDGKITYHKGNADYIIAAQALELMIEAYTYDDQFYSERGELSYDSNAPEYILGEYYTINDLYLSQDKYLGFDKELYGAETVGEFYEEIKRFIK